MSSEMDAVKRVIDAFERSDWREIDVRTGDLRVHLSVSSDSATDRSAPSRAGVDATISPSPARSDGFGDRDTGVEAPAIPDGARVVAAPSPGVFWRSPEPGAPHFTDVGRSVESSSTVCIVEVMKLMNHVKAGVAGVVLEVFVDNGVAVAADEPLFAIDPDGSAS